MLGDWATTVASSVLTASERARLVAGRRFCVAEPVARFRIPSTSEPTSTRRSSRTGALLCCSAPILTSQLALTPGTRLGVYDITAPIGEGGMGQVHRATDAKLKRHDDERKSPFAVIECGAMT